MKYQYCYKWIIALLACGCLFLFGAISFHSTSTIYARSILATPTPLFTSISTATPKARPTPTVINLSETSSFPDPTSVIAIIGLIIAFLGMVVAAVTLYFIIKYVRDTAAMAVATRDSAKAAEMTVQEMKATRDEENAPFVVVYFNHYQSFHSLYLVVENIGKKVATDIKLKFTPRLQVTEFNKDLIAKNSLLNNGIKSLVPNYKIPIPFDFLTHYLKANLPMEYEVTVTYQGNPSLPPIVLEYTLDLSHYNYIHFQTEPGLNQIDTTLTRFALDINQHLNQFRSIPYDLKEIANALNRDVMAQYNQRADGNNIDILAKLKEFVLIWTLDYGKEEEKLKKSSMFDLRTKCLLVKDDILIGIANGEPHQWIEDVKTVIVKMSKLGNMTLLLDGYVVAESRRGHSIEDFNKLGDSIIEDIKSITEQINNENNTSLISSREDTNGSISIKAEENENSLPSEIDQ